jgi:hypothetical protein
MNPRFSTREGRSTGHVSHSTLPRSRSTPHSTNTVHSLRGQAHDTGNDPRCRRRSTVGHTRDSLVVNDAPDRWRRSALGTMSLDGRDAIRTRSTWATLASTRGQLARLIRCRSAASIRGSSRCCGAPHVRKVGALERAQGSAVNVSKRVRSASS